MTRGSLTIVTTGHGATQHGDQEPHLHDGHCSNDITVQCVL